MSHPFRALGAAVSCPRCQTAFEADLCVVVEAAPGVSPSSINQVVCPGCGHRFLAPVPFLWYDAAAEVACAWVPADLDLPPEELVTALLARYLQGAASPDLPDYLLEPAVCRDADGLTHWLQGEAGDAPDGLLAAASAWAAEQGAPEVVRLLEPLAEVGDLAGLVAAINAHPEFLEPTLIARLVALGEAAEATPATAAIGERLRDLAAALRLHTPDLGDDDGLPAPGPERDELQAALIAGDLEPATAYLEPPVREDHEEFRRAMLPTIEPELREGFTDHARLFGGLVDDMIAADSMPHPDDPLPAPEEARLAPGELEPLLAAAGFDEAIDILTAHPELISQDAADLLRRQQQAALDAGDDGLASHLDQLVQALYIMAASDDDPEGETDVR